VATEQQRTRSLPGTAENGLGAGSLHPERFDPEQSAGTLMDSEHRGRYCWAAQLLAGKSILDAGCGTGYGLAIMAEAGAGELTGVDLDEGAVAAARGRTEQHGATVTEGDLHALGFPDASFDAAVCFETIEHLASPEQGLAELRRVVRPGGMLLVSSPNPDVYPSGNQHHLHELRPDELCGLVGEHFKAVGSYVQHAWLASVIEPAEAHQNGNGDDSRNRVGMRHTAPPLPNGATFTIVVGCDQEPPRASSLVSLGDPFEVKWWQEQVQEAARSAEARAQAAEERAAEADRRAVEVESKVAALAEQQLEAGRALREGQVREASLSERLRESSQALVDANQELAQMPLLKHRLAEMYGEKAVLGVQLQEVFGSRSWQLTGFLRKLSHALKLQR
jgi:ubiquinone/menaquinone biosynthesis C-methylase UbiE